MKKEERKGENPIGPTSEKKEKVSKDRTGTDMEKERRKSEGTA